MPQCFYAFYLNAIWKWSWSELVCDSPNTMCQSFSTVSLFYFCLLIIINTQAFLINVLVIKLNLTEKNKRISNWLLYLLLLYTYIFFLLPLLFNMQNKYRFIVVTSSHDIITTVDFNDFSFGLCVCDENLLSTLF